MYRHAIDLNNKDFKIIQDFIYKNAGITLNPNKKALVSGRLEKRLKQIGCKSYQEYFSLLNGGKENNEAQCAIDLLTTNETYFFREHKHFDFLREKIFPDIEIQGRLPKIWSAASSSGEEPYSTSMLLADYYGYKGWFVLATDLSHRVLEKAKKGIYPMKQAEKIPAHYLKTYCLKGIGSQEGNFIVSRQIRERVHFKWLNLNDSFPKNLGQFDVIFLRNVMIYFNLNTRQTLCRRLINHIRPGGYLFVGHSESLNGVTDALTAMAPSIYRRV